MSLAYLKGLKSRYKNLLEVELGKSEELLTREVSDFDLESQIRKVNKSYRRFDEFGPKFEETLERLSLALETAKAEEDLKTFQKESELYFNIITEVTSRKEELKLIDNFLQEKYKNLSKPEPDSKIEQLIEIQIQMMQQMQLQNAKPQHDELNQAAVKLPKLEIMGYNGDKQKFKEFWDQFEVTVHKNTKLSNVEKFSYLKSKLHGTAQSAISGLQLSNENYDVAIDILKDRFGDIQNAVNAHYVELINLSCASNRTSELRFLYVKIERNLRSLEALNQNIDQDVFISMITTKLPEAVLVQLEIQKGSDRWTVDKLRDLLKSYIAAREAAEIQSKEKTNDSKPQQPSYANVQSRYKPSYGKPQNVRSSGEALFSTTNDMPFTPTRTEVKKLCIYCKGSHWSDECSLYKTVEDRKAQLNGLCYICLKSGHRLRECSSDRKCVYCSKTKKHHRSLCLKKFPTNRTEISNLVDEAVESTESVNVSLTTEPSFLSSGDIVLMQTAKTVFTNTSDTCNEEIRVLLDSGSQRTYVSETLAKKLRLKVESVEEVSVITFGSDKPKLVKTEKVTLQMKLVDGTKMKISANVVPKITGSVLRRPVSIKNCQNYEYLWNNFSLADTLPTENEKTTIELLIGNDYYLDIILPEKIEIQPGLYLLGSKFGWIITGRTSEKSDGFEEPSMLILNYGTNALPLLDSCAVTAIDKSMPIKPPLEDFWNLETIGISEPSEDSNDTKALEKFNNSVEYTNERYLVCWPWKSELETLNDNKELAYGRYRSLLHRLRNKPELFENYDKIINEQCEKGIIEKVDVTNKHEDHITHYIPHHAVVDSTKPTTKVRIVYDASAKTRDDNKSLNNCLYRGPVMLKDLCGLFYSVVQICRCC
ncbi:Hypothetical predicted protein [Mytilus galloprovincialis]|uniref:CCHC-type domain-containing protein n=1 Tax=Mytilus galloprovincialis TaxID=29158 RepID=A0A8B6HEB8_MYTGA|nr:Hypothetical predicted protein [Mytilus galloprovincialis]